MEWSGRFVDLMQETGPDRVYKRVYV